ncbi:MAG: hypothetical protein ABIH00_00035 [Armatimonadota bacterium]
MKKNTIIISISIIFIFLLINTAYSSNKDEQIVYYRFMPINEINVNNLSNRFVVVNEESNNREDIFTYAITTNGDNKKITGYIDSDMPEGTCLMLKLEAPSSGNSLGYIILNTRPSDLVTAVSRVAEKDKKIDYKFTSNKDNTHSIQKTVTLTITD